MVGNSPPGTRGPGAAVRASQSYGDENVEAEHAKQPHADEPDQGMPLQPGCVPVQRIRSLEYRQVAQHVTQEESEQSRAAESNKQLLPDRGAEQPNQPNHANSSDKPRNLKSTPPCR